MQLPNFIIIGAYKSGTTSLYKYLNQHPEVFMSRIKEPNYFAHEKYARLMQQSDLKPDIIDNMNSYLALFSEVRNEKAIGEASPIYLSTPSAAKRIKKTIPEAKLIAILRQPVDAFYSDHGMRIRKKRKLESDFRGRFKDLECRIQSGQVSGPMYYAQLKTYYELFDPSKIRVYLYEDLRDESKAVLQDIFRFLGVDDTFLPNTAKQYNAGGISRIHKLNELLKKLLKMRNVKRSAFMTSTLSCLQQANIAKAPPLSLALRSKLTAIFRTDIQNLEELINRDLQQWLS